MIKNIKSVKYTLIIILLILLSVTVTGCKSNENNQGLEYYGNITVSDENKILGDIILSLFPDELKEENVPIVSTEQKDSDLIFTLFNLNSEILDSYAILTSKDNSSINTIAIVAPKLAYEEEVITGLTIRISKLIDGKDAEEKQEILGKVVLEQFLDTKYLVLIIDDNSDIIFKEIGKGLANLDSTQVDVIENITGVIELNR